MKRTRLFLALFALMLIPSAAMAFTVKNDTSVYIGKDEVVDGNLYATGQTITVEGLVKGDLICAAQTVNVNGKVEGDVLCVGQNLNIRGEVGGNVRSAGDTINIDGQIGRQLMAFGSNINLGSNSKVAWDAFLAAATIEARGTIGRDLYGGASRVVLDGEVGKNIRLRLDGKNNESSKLNIDGNAVVKGDLVYTSDQEAQIAEGAKLEGEKIKHDPLINSGKQGNKTNDRFIGTIFSIFASLLFGLVLVSLWRRPINEIASKIKDKPWETLAIGFAVLFLVPIICILLMFTLIGIPLAIALFLSYILVIMIGKVIAAILLGKEIVVRIKPTGDKDQTMLAMILGVISLWILSIIPFLGGIITFLALIWGIGGLFNYVKASVKS